MISKQTIAASIAIVAVLGSSPLLGADRVALFDGIPGLTVDVAQDETSITITHAEKGFHLVLPFSSTWQFHIPRNQEYGLDMFRVSDGRYSASVAPVLKNTATVQEHFENYLSDLTASRYLHSRFIEIVDISGHAVLCYQSRRIDETEWRWIYVLLIPATDGWHQLIFTELPNDELQPYDLELLEIIVNGFRGAE